VHARPVTVVNYDQYRKLEDKKERILLKKKLYLHKRETDRAKLQDLGKKSVQVKNENINIQRILRDLNNELTECSKQVRQENRNLLDETKAAERRKREATLKRT
jgi:3-deoxy-D-manno-octulosonic-acid transferase